MTITVWPEILKARIWDPHLRNLASSGGTSATGRTQRIFGDAGLWEVRVSDIAVRNRAQAAAYRALIARLRTGEDILLPVRDLYAAVGSRVASASATLAGDAALRATEIALSVSGIDVEPGHHLTLGDRLHLVTEVVAGPTEATLLNQLVSDSAWSDALPWSDTVDGSVAYTVKLLPPLRAAAASGNPVQFKNLALRCVLKDTGDGDLDLDLGRLGRPSLTFIESI